MARAQVAELIEAQPQDIMQMVGEGLLDEPIFAIDVGDHGSNHTD